MKYKLLKQHMKKAVKQMVRKYHQQLCVNFDEQSVGFNARRDTGDISIGVKDICLCDDILFADSVYYIISVFHECAHAIQYRKVWNSDVLTENVKDYCVEYMNRDYYLQTYYHSSLEQEAQLIALQETRLFLYKIYPGHEDAIDKHILYWGLKWFEDPDDFMYHNGLDVSNCDTLDGFFDEFTRYQVDHWDNTIAFSYEYNTWYSDVIWKVLKQHESIGREHPYDVCFKNTDDLRLQRDAAFLINISNNKEVVDLAPVVKDKNQVQIVEQEVMNWYMDFVRLNEKDDIEEQVNKGLGE